MRLSASTIASCQECTLKSYWHNVVKPIEVPQNHFGVFGTLLHWTIKEVIEHSLFDQWNIVKNMYTEKYSNLFLKNELLEKPDNEGFYYSGLKILHGWRKDFQDRGWHKAQNLMLEKYFRIPVKKNLMFSGFVDYLMEFEGEIYLIDWKSNKKTLTEEDIKDNIQLNMYYWAGQQYNVAPDKVGLYFLRSNTYVSVERCQDDVEHLFNNAFEVESRFLKKDLEANYSKDNCKWCGYTSICDAYKNKEVMNYDKLNKNFINK